MSSLRKSWLNKRKVRKERQDAQRYGMGGELKRLPFFSLEKEIIVRRCDGYKPEKVEKIHRKHFFIMSYVRKNRCHLNDQASGLSQYTQSTVMLWSSFPQDAPAPKRIN